MSYGIDNAASAALNDIDRVLGLDRRRHRRPPPKPYKNPAVPGQYIQMFGSLTNGQSYQSFYFTTLAGPSEPIIQGGFAQWGVVDRPRRVGMTVLQGYDPLSMIVELQFDVVVVEPAPGETLAAAQLRAAQNIENDIAKLEWMGGRGRHYVSQSSALAPGSGDSPLVSVYSLNHNSTETALIPPTVQDVLWVVSNISYTQGALRNSAGNRVRQIVDVTLTQFISAPGSSNDSPSTRAKQRDADQHKFAYYPVTDADYDYMHIAATARIPGTVNALAILNANKTNGNLSKVRSVTADLRKYVKNGTKVRVPLALAQHV